MKALAGPSRRRKRQSRCDNFSMDEKKKLIEKVEARPVIWDITNAQHCHSSTVKATWQEIADEMDKSVALCKTAWISIRESHRYRQRRMRAALGADGVDQDDLVKYDPLEWDWELAEALRFLPDVSQKRATSISGAPRSSQRPREDMESEPESSDRCSGKSHYHYTNCTWITNRRSRSQTSGILDDPLSELEESATDMVSLPLTSAPVSSSSSSSPSFKYLTEQMAIDRLLQRLPEEDALEQLYAFTAQLQGLVLDYLRNVSYTKS